MVSKWVRVFILGVGLGVLIEALIFLSPLFETTLWKTYCTFAKIIPLMILYITAIIGVILIIISIILTKASMLLERKT
ncbi:MAG: hypothetical protein DRO40_01800 [Thermoprotei archaeon]|mgnify:CR=1 FL=1|nr:MAG: hypothetical protein DRO40_01800 [Thermoprotei archaeon]